jgi:penicillin-binding protein 2
MPDPDWKVRTQKTPWYAGETVSVAIGQGQVSATPLQLARAVSVIANGGNLVRPHLVRGGDADEPPRPLGIHPETLEVVKEGMRRVVAGGTGRRARLGNVDVCGKTGSAQVVAHARLEREPGDPSLLPHGWFLAFAPAENPQIALAVLVEHGGSGGGAAAPVARSILARFFAERGAPATASAAKTPAKAGD